MSESTDSQAIGLWSGGEASPFAQTLIYSRRLVARVTLFDGAQVTMIFDVTGADQAFVPVREACGW